jgi:hypothetical protein
MSGANEYAYIGLVASAATDLHHSLVYNHEENAFEFKLIANTYIEKLGAFAFEDDDERMVLTVKVRFQKLWPFLAWLPFAAPNALALKCIEVHIRLDAILDFKAVVSNNVKIKSNSYVWCPKSVQFLLDAVASLDIDNIICAFNVSRNPKLVSPLVCRANIVKNQKLLRTMGNWARDFHLSQDTSWKQVKL